MLNEKYELLNEIKIPQIGFGTWEISNDKAAEAVINAINAGYRLIDTAQGYDNEEGVGNGILNSGINRSEIFVTTKLQAFYKTYSEAKEAINVSLKKSGLEYFDMILIHAPQPWTDYHSDNHYFEGNLEAWRALEEAYREGKVRVIGVANFEEEDIENIIKNAEIKPAVNQILCHIGNSPLGLINYCQNKGIVVESYSPIAHGEMVKNKFVSDMAKEYNVSTAQLCIRYCLQLGTIPLPKAINPVHIADNINLDFRISLEDMEQLKKTEKIKNYGEFSIFPVFGGKMSADGICTPYDFPHKKGIQ